MVADHFDFIIRLTHAIGRPMKRTRVDESPPPIDDLEAVMLTAYEPFQSGLKDLVQRFQTSHYSLLLDDLGHVVAADRREAVFKPATTTYGDSFTR